MIGQRLSATSFRDPAGFMFVEGGVLYRQINKAYKPHYETLCESGLAEALFEDRLLIRHEVVGGPVYDLRAAHAVIRPELIDFISFPYEWSFSQLKDAALTTLAIERRALDRGMSLKDASAYNIQFQDGRPILIDTLSFEGYEEGRPWVAYRQFCQHFLAPLALMSLTDARLNQLCRTNLDGVPLDLAARLLPSKSKMRFGLLIHLHLHAMLQRSASGENPSKATPAANKKRFSRQALLGLIDSLESTIHRLDRKKGGMGWADYYQNNTYQSQSRDHKRTLVSQFIDEAGPSRVWDLGANVGDFSRIAADRGIFTVSFDIDAECVEANYNEMKRRNETKILPLILDLTNPSPASGWRNEERPAIFDRSRPDLIMALALIHHLVFTGNQPLENVADLFRSLAPWLIIEFVPEDDPQTIRLLAPLDGKHHEYSREHFEECFGRHYSIRHSVPIEGSGRVLYLMSRRDVP
ncbi:MAG: hypothetical protein ABS79_07070 [Planctomycetes bacterium SCN 63-9]|nr:MAG: hypothetical protein ABS79_07070 [Planctomycetes bacterium SCN 63-9]